MSARNVAEVDAARPAVISRPHLVWRVLILAFCLAAALTFLRSVLLVIQGEPVEIMQIIFSVGFLGFGAWLYPQQFTVDADGVELTRAFGLLRTRIPLKEIDFYWETNRKPLAKLRAKRLDFWLGVCCWLILG